VQNASFTQPSQTPAPDKVNLAGLLGPMTISGFVDAYYGYSYNHPFNNENAGFQGYTPFTSATNAFALNMVELVVDKAPDATSTESRFGYHVAAGYGQAAAAVNGSDITGDGSNFYLKEAYGQYLAPIGKGLTIQVGKFVTPAGAEVIESNGNFNYSRSVLFQFAIPYFHFGVNAKYAFSPKFATTFYLVNGWNNSAIFHDEGAAFGTNSSGLTYGVSAAYTPNAKWSATENFFAGPVTDATNFNTGKTFNDYKYLTDTVIGYTPNAKWAFTLNGDYGYGPKVYNVNTILNTATAAGPAIDYWGVAGYAKYTINPKSYFAARYEYFGDPDGFALAGDDDAADHFHIQEATGTYAYNVTSGLQVRAEYRYDFASEPAFVVGANKFVKENNSAWLAFIYSFSSANAK
jgi:hypothetical protein